VTGRLTRDAGQSTAAGVGPDASPRAALGEVETARRPATGSREAIAAGHHLAARAGFEVLERGGNAIDAGVAAGIALAVVESEYVNFAGVAPILIYVAERREVFAISGLGPWPRRASCAFFNEQHGGVIPAGILRSVVPGAPDAWITALEHFGTLSFGEVAKGAIALARDGFEMYPLMARIIEEFVPTLRQWPANAEIYLPQGAPPRTGERFYQTDLARTLQFLADEEAAHVRRGRRAGLQAVRKTFYHGDIARQIVEFQQDNDGLLGLQDMAEFRARIEPAPSVKFGSVDVYSCPPWCQGPMLLQELALLDNFDLCGLGHNSSAYVHYLTEAIKLAAADREAYFGDPDFVNVPLERLLSRSYLEERRRLIRPNRAWPDLATAGIVPGWALSDPGVSHGLGTERPSLDTSYLCVVDRHGNAFSATPSDGSMDAPVVPGLGFAVSARGEQAWTDPAHPSCVAPGKRPRLTPNPAIAIREGEFVMPFGSPGMDFQTQIMLQILCNVVVFGMDPQAAVEAPRFASRGFPSSSWPHDYDPAVLLLDLGIEAEVVETLQDLGHKVEPWPTEGIDYYLYSCCACMIYANCSNGILQAGADPRRPSQALAR